MADSKDNHASTKVAGKIHKHCSYLIVIDFFFVANCVNQVLQCLAFIHIKDYRRYVRTGYWSNRQPCPCQCLQTIMEQPSRILRNPEKSREIPRKSRISMDHCWCLVIRLFFNQVFELGRGSIIPVVPSIRRSRLSAPKFF